MLTLLILFLMVGGVCGGGGGGEGDSYGSVVDNQIVMEN